MRSLTFALLLPLAGCASPLASASNALTALSQTATRAEPVLEAEYEAAQRPCLVEHEGDKAAMRACVAPVRARWQPVWTAYRDFRKAWLAADATLRAAEAASALGQPVDLPGVLTVVLRALDAAAAYRALLGPVVAPQVAPVPSATTGVVPVPSATTGVVP